MSNESKSPTNFAEAEVRLAESLPGYEQRPQQQSFALAVESALANGTHLISEAGTGVGKSLGYLIPSIIAAKAQGKRAVISTATKALQDQVADKDVPFLKEHLGVDFTAAVLKGKSNYLCLSQLTDSDSKAAGEVKVFIKANREAGGDIWNGEREGLPFEVEDREWRDLVTTADACPGAKMCPIGEACYAERAKAAAKEADITVVNHALLLTDLKVRTATNGNADLIGPYDFLVVDEAHEMEDWASQMFGARIAPGSFVSLVRNVTSLTDRTDAPEAVSEAVTAAVRTVEGAVSDLWGRLSEGRLRPNDFLANETEWVELVNSIYGLREAFAKVKSSSEGETARIKQVRQQIYSLHANLLDLVAAPHDELVRWVEVENKGKRFEAKVLRSSPIEVGPILRQGLWAGQTSVLVSATMSVGGSFDYLAGRLGMDDYQTLIVDTPFDYAEQASLYVPKDLASPKTGAAWEQGVLEEMDQLVRASDGRALLLFTSRKAMERAFNVLANGRRPLPYKCMMQGNGQSNQAILAEFKADTHSVLFALRSFFTGVDVQGEALSLVVIDKLPFPVPTEPVTEARCEAIKAKGGSDFTEYTIPVMSLILQQAFGRLIRHRQDSGTVAILDSRLHTGWGGKIMRSLPPAERVTAMAEVESFFQPEGAVMAS